jgi:hypothetical protein
MFYRVDYLLAVSTIGALLGWVLGRRWRGADPGRMARAYFLASVAAAAARVAATLVYAGFGDSLGLWPIVRDLGNLVVGALFGMALASRRPLLREPAILDALCLSTGVWFATGGLGSTFVLDWMTKFFHESGYAPGFLRLIIAIEVVGGMALLVRWAVPLGLGLLAVDMFGAIYTHLHNGDGIDADMDALAMLLRLGTIAVLWQVGRRSDVPIRRAFGIAAAGAALCLVAAVAGAQLVRQLS